MITGTFMLQTREYAVYRPIMAYRAVLRLIRGVLTAVGRSWRGVEFKDEIIMLGAVGFGMIGTAGFGLLYLSLNIK